jgi:hypothetical protein
MVQTVRMSSRDEVDLVAIMSQVVGPVLGEVLQAGELDEVMVSWGGEVQLPDGSRSTPTELRLVLECVGEEFTMPIWTLGQDQFDLSLPSGTICAMRCRTLSPSPVSAGANNVSDPRARQAVSTHSWRHVRALVGLTLVGLYSSNSSARSGRFFSAEARPRAIGGMDGCLGPREYECQDDDEQAKSDGEIDRSASCYVSEALLPVVGDHDTAWYAHVATTTPNSTASCQTLTVNKRHRYRAASTQASQGMKPSPDRQLPLAKCRTFANSTARRSAPRTPHSDVSADSGYGRI